MKQVMMARGIVPAQCIIENIEEEAFSVCP